MLYVTFRVIGGDEDRLIERYKLDPKIHVDDLRKDIETFTCIPSKYQDIKFRGEELPDCIHPLESVKDFEELVVKHSMLSNWPVILERAEAFEQTDDEDLKKSISRETVILMDDLAKTQFFLAYPTLGTSRFKIMMAFSNHFDYEMKAIKGSCQLYFKKLCGEHIKIAFEPRELPTRRGCLCILEDESRTTKYFVKTLHKREDIDLREMFVNKFLPRVQ